MTALGLTPAGEAAYRLALTESSWSIDELVGRVARQGQPEERARDAVDELVDLSLLRPSDEDRQRHVRVVSPAVALEHRLADARRGVLDQQSALDRSARLLGELQEHWVRARDSHLEQTVERLTGLDAIRGKLEHLAREAHQEVLAFMRGAQSPDSMAASRPLDEAALARGVNLRAVYQHGALNDPTTLAYLRWSAAAGAEARTVATLPLQMIIVDRAVAVLPIEVEQQSAGAQVVRGSGLMTALLALFESVWSAGRPFEERRIALAHLSDAEAEIVRILATGATDEVVARQLGVSMRTVRRLMSALMDRHGAQSRFELGVKLGRLGWDPGATAQRSG